MHPLRLDYHRKAGAARRWAGLSILGLGLMAAVLSTVIYARLHRESRAVAATIARLQRMGGYPSFNRRASREGDAALNAAVNDANAMMRRLTLPWNTLFGSLAASETRNIALLSIKPAVKSHTLLISGEAKNLAGLLDYLRRLTQQAVFRDVTLISHRIRRRVAGNPVHFLVSVRWAR